MAAMAAAATAAASARLPRPARDPLAERSPAGGGGFGGGRGGGGGGLGSGARPRGDAASAARAGPTLAPRPSSRPARHPVGPEPAARLREELLHRAPGRDRAVRGRRGRVADVEADQDRGPRRAQARVDVRGGVHARLRAHGGHEAGLQGALADPGPGLAHGAPRPRHDRHLADGLGQDARVPAAGHDPHQRAALPPARRRADRPRPRADARARGADQGRVRQVWRVVADGAGEGCEIPNFKGSSLGRFPLGSAEFWTSDHPSERSRVDAFRETRARAEHSR